MANTLVIELDDADYNTLKLAADNNGANIETWVLNTVREALAESAISLRNRGAEDSNGWPQRFFETTYGSLADDPIERLPQSEPETREMIR